jgi:3-methyladenine DNA glycosylase AlkD
MKDILKLKRNLDNWASVDGFGVYVTGIQWRLGTIDDSWIEELLDSDDHWERRLAVVSTVALNLKSRGGTGDAPRTLWVCEQVIDDRQDMVVKALSWALRELSKRENRLVSDFLEKHKNSLANRVVREVSHKLEFGTKN